MLNHFSHIWLFATLWTIAHQPPYLGFSPKTETLAKNTGLGCHFLLQGIFSTQGSNLHLMSPALEGKFFTTRVTSPCLMQAIYRLLEAFCCCYLVPKSCLTLLRTGGLQPTRLLCPWDFPGKNTGKGHYFLLQGIFLTQGSNAHLLQWQMNSFPLNHQGRPETFCFFPKQFPPCTFLPHIPLSSLLSI